MQLIAKAMHDIEWVDSSDYGRGDELEAIKAALGKDVEAQVLTLLVADAREAHAALGEQIKKVSDA